MVLTTLMYICIFAACYEGLCSASAILICPRVKSPALRRVESMVVKPGSSLSKEAKIRAGQLSVFALFFSPTCLEAKFRKFLHLFKQILS